MANTPWFARPRALKLMASLCVLCALAFMLGQETAAYHAVQLQMQADAATSHTTAPPIPAISTAAAHGSRLAASHVAPAAVFLASASHPASGNGHVGQQGKHGKHGKQDKQHDAKQHAAGDSSHGGISHHGGGSHHHGSHHHDG